MGYLPVAAKNTAKNPAYSMPIVVMRSAPAPLKPRLQGPAHALHASHHIHTDSHTFNA
jgi:hypothetical protein